jgi:hypothetical protein
MFVGAITASLDAASLSIPQGRSGDIPVAVTSLGGPDAAASFTLNDPVPGIAVTNPDVDVPSGATVHATLHVVVSRDAPLGDHRYGVAVSAFGGRQTLGLGWLTITVTPLPIQQVTIPLGLAKTIWDQARDAACERIKDLTGQEVLAYYGRSLRDPHCYLAPLQLTATKSGDELQVTGTAIRSWVDLKLTTPDGIPRDLDPMFTVYFDVHVSIAVQLPQTLDGMSMLRVTSATVDLQNVYIDSDNATGDLIEALAKAFGGSAYFHPAEYALGNVGVVVDAVNSALSQLDGALKAAPALGFTQIDFGLDPSTLDLTVALS